MNKKVIGIIGGMGPAATAALFDKIIGFTSAECDADHIHILVDNYPQIPDRTTAIKKNSDEPLKYICESGKKLISAGADFLLIPCNTSHFFYDKIQNCLEVPVVNMIEETAKHCKSCGYKKVGVLATDGTRYTGVFDTYLDKNGLTTVYPSEDGQAELMNVIYNQVKAGKKIDTVNLSRYLYEMSREDIDAFILGCTELPLAIKDGDYGLKFINTLDILAKVGIVKAGYKLI